MAGSAFRMYLFSRLRNLLLLLHICFQTLAEKKTLQKRLLPPLSRPRRVRGAQAHRRRGLNKLITGTMNEEENLSKRAKDCSLRRNGPKGGYRERSKRVFSKRKLATHREERR